MGLSSAPHLITHELNEISITHCRSRGSSKSPFVDLETRSLKGKTIGLRDLVKRNSGKLFGKSTSEKRQSLSVNEIEHSHGKTGEDKGDVQLFSDKMLDGRRDFSHFVGICILHFIERDQKAPMLARKFGGLFRQSLPQGKIGRSVRFRMEIDNAEMHVNARRSRRSIRNSFRYSIA